MLERGVKLTSLRREVLAALLPGGGTSPDELRWKVALRRGVALSGPSWLAFGTSFARCLRLLEEKGCVSVARENVLFKKPCMSWVALTASGERERERAMREGAPLGAPEPELVALVAPLLASAPESELLLLSALIQEERARRSEPARC